MKLITNFLKSVSRVSGLVIACCPLFAHAAPTIGDRYTVNFSGLNIAHAEFALGNQLADGNFLIEDFRIRISARRWNPPDMLQGFYNPQVNRLVQCLDSSCTQYLATASGSQFGLIGFGNSNEWNFSLGPPQEVKVAGAYDVNPVPTNGTYTVAFNALFCISQQPCDPFDPLFNSGHATFAVGSQLAGGNYEIQRLIVELGLLSFFAPDMLQGFYNPQVNRLVRCLDSSCTQYSVTASRSQFGVIGFGNNNEWNFNSAVSSLGDARGTYAITPALIPEPPTLVPEPPTYAMIMAGLGLLGIVARRRKQQATV